MFVALVLFLGRVVEGLHLNFYKVWNAFLFYEAYNMFSFALN